MASFRYQIDVELSVFKALTALMEDGQNHNDVLRDLLNLDSPLEPETQDTSFTLMADTLGRVTAGGQFYSRGLMLPDGTELHARYKGRLHKACVRDGSLFTEDGVEHDSPSAAAKHITSNTVNGLRFWNGKRPQDQHWRRLDAIRDLR